MRGIQKNFGAVHALRDVNLRLMPGEILGLVGDNSAGKSTLMKIMTGAYQRDEGEVLVDGQPTHFKSPHESREVGIEMIYQDFALCGNLDVAPTSSSAAGRPRARSSTASACRRRPGACCKRLKVDVNHVRQQVESLSGGRQQSVAIARAISFAPKVLILDEPTANLSVMATERLLETMAELKRQGVAQIIISHRLNDIFAVGDRVMVLKRGRNAGERYDHAHQRARGAGADRVRHPGDGADRRRGAGPRSLGPRQVRASPALATPTRPRAGSRCGRGAPGRRRGCALPWRRRPVPPARACRRPVVGMAVDIGQELRRGELAVDHVALELGHVDAVGGEAAQRLVERGRHVADAEDEGRDGRPVAGRRPGGRLATGRRSGWCCAPRPRRPRPASSRP